MANEVQDFLKAVNEQSGDMFETDNKDAFEITLEDKKEDTTSETKEDEVVPFHKDPKVQRFIDKQVAKALENHRPVETERIIREVRSDEEDEGTRILTKVIGNDTPEKIEAIRDMKKYLSSLEEKGAQKALKQLQDAEDQRIQDEVRAKEELDTYFDNIEETYNVDITSNTPAAKKTRDEFVEFVKRISPKDRNGDVVQFPDLVESFDAFQKISKIQTPPNRAKELADRSRSRSSDASNNAPKPADNSWAAVDRFFSSLTK